jgi:aspartyl/glutamyl-tRNA(Asn/Gln) amidotransferase C subunit
MKKINKEILKESANKLMFDMDESQYDTLLEEFSIIIQQMDMLSNVPGIEEATPMVFPFDVTTSVLREDVVENVLDRNEALKNANDVVDGHIRLPKVVG